MSYNPATDFPALLRSTSGGVRTERMPGLDFVVLALARAGLIAISVGQSAPVTNQASTVWFQPQVPSTIGEGAVFLWNSATSTYQAATPVLWSDLICGPFLALIPQPAVVAPLIDGVASVGTSALYARQDHVHPTDTSRAAVNSPTLTGTPQAPTAALGDNSLLIATTAFVIANGGLPPPIGAVLSYTANVAPGGGANWALAQGQAVSRTGATANLFAIISTTYGSGDGVTTFNLPDLRGRVVAGVDGGANRLTTATMSSQALAGVGGAETHALTTAELASHTHGITDPQHLHVLNQLAAASANVSPSFLVGGISSTSNVSSTTNNSGTGVTVNSNGSGTAHINVQPTMELQYIIRIA